MRNESYEGEDNFQYPFFEGMKFDRNGCNITFPYIPCHKCNSLMKFDSAYHDSTNHWRYRCEAHRHIQWVSENQLKREQLEL